MASNTCRVCGREITQNIRRLTGICGSVCEDSIGLISKSVTITHRDIERIYDALDELERDSSTMHLGNIRKAKKKIKAILDSKK